MMPRTYRDPPPSYAEATGAVTPHNPANNHANSQVDNRRHSASTFISYAGPTTTAPRSSAYLPSPYPNSNSYSHTYYSQSPYPYSQRNSSGGGVADIFPPSFSVYYQRARHYVIGETQHLPLYAVSTHSSLSGRPDVVVYTGATEDTPPLAFVEHEPFGRSAGITLPSLWGARVPASHELLKSAGSLTRTVMTFDIETDASSGVREHFEWRHSSGVEVEALALGNGSRGGGIAGGKRSGWKLVRVLPAEFSPHTAQTSQTATPATPTSSSSPQLSPFSTTPAPTPSSSSRANSFSVSNPTPTTTITTTPTPIPSKNKKKKKNAKANRKDKKRARSTPGRTSSGNTGTTTSSSDGKEVVAVWAGAGMFATRALRFRFLGSGADGSLGDRWAVMAVASALAIWNRERGARGRGIATASF